MTAELIDGNALSRQLRADVALRAAALKARGITPGLAVILVGENPASQVYVRNKVKACEDSGLHSVLEKYDAEMSEAALLARVAALNADPASLKIEDGAIVAANGARTTYWDLVAGNDFDVDATGRVVNAMVLAVALDLARQNATPEEAQRTIDATLALFFSGVRG